MLRNVKVISNIEDRLRDHRERCSITVDKLSAELEEARLLAMRTHKPAAAVRAIVAKARLHRFV